MEEYLFIPLIIALLILSMFLVYMLLLLTQQRYKITEIQRDEKGYVKSIVEIYK